MTEVEKLETRNSSKGTQIAFDPSMKVIGHRTIFPVNASSPKITIKSSRIFCHHWHQNTKSKRRFSRRRKIHLKPLIHFTHSSRILGRRFPMRIRMWLANKLRSDRRKTCQARQSKTYERMACKIKNIFKCIQTTSEITVPQGLTSQDSNGKPEDLIKEKSYTGKQLFQY